MNGSCEWFIPDCYWPEITTPGHYVSHEAICVLNTCAEDADIELTLYFEDAEPIEGFTAKCPRAPHASYQAGQADRRGGQAYPDGQALRHRGKEQCAGAVPVFAAGYYAGEYVAYDDHCRAIN